MAQPHSQHRALEPLPKLHYRLDVKKAAAYSPKTDNWMAYQNPQELEDRVFSRYDFITEKNYASKGSNIPVDGRGIYYEYDEGRLQYRKKQLFIVGPFVYALRKNESHGGSFPSGSAVSYLDRILMRPTQTVPKRFELSKTSFSDGFAPLSRIRLNEYNYVGGTPFFAQSGTSSPTLYQNTRYTAYAELSFCGRRGEHPPYWEVWAEDLVPLIEDASPSGCFVDKTEDVTLSWRVEFRTRRASFEGLHDVAGTVGGQIIERPVQKSAVVRWRQQGSSTIHTIEVGEQTQAVIPQGQLTADSFEWQVEVTTDDGVQGKAQSWFSATTNNDAKSTARAVSPKHMVVDGTTEQEFVWEHQIATGTRPTRSELMYSTDMGSSWRALADVRTRQTRCLVPAGTLPAGLLQWRVRTYNTSGTAGDWSEPAVITCYGAPARPQILSVGDDPLPLLRWSGEGQRCAQVSVDEQTRTLYGSGQSLVWDTILPDGEHRFAVRIQNEYSLWSPWASQSAIIRNEGQPPVTLLARPVQNGVCLHWEQTYPTMELYRDGRRIARLHEGFEYFDWESAAPATYTMYGIGEQGHYTKSGAVQAAPLVCGAALGDGQGEWIGLSGRYHTPPEHRRRVQALGVVRRYLGRSLPVAYPAAQREVWHELFFSVGRHEQDKLLRMEALSGHRVIYKDSRGDLAIGILSELTCIHNGQYIEVRFCILEAEEEGM